jgi:two-component system response regulator CpxR
MNHFLNEKLPLLVIDDDQDIRELLREILESEGYRVTTAENGLEGLKKMNGFRGIVLLDFMMPIMNGEEFLDALQSDTALANVPVVMISANAKEINSRRAQDFLPKPLSIETLLESLAKISCA